VLVLSRKIHQSILIGETIRVTMVSIRGRQVRLAIEAPREVRIVREELDHEPERALRSSGLTDDLSASPPRARATPSDTTSRSLTPRRRIDRE
jgi:carbon storage regulator